MSQGGRKNVVFFGGFFFKYCPMHLGTKEISQLNWEDRSGEKLDKAIIPNPENDRAAYVVEAIEVGAFKVTNDKDV
jgi:hypothetical protein